MLSVRHRDDDSPVGQGRERRVEACRRRRAIEPGEINVADSHAWHDGIAIARLEGEESSRHDHNAENEHGEERPED